MIIKSKYPDLIKFIFPVLRLEEEIPLLDGFFLVKDLNHREVEKLEDYRNYIVISENFASNEWTRQEIVDHVVRANRSRKKPKFEWMNEEEFIKAVKFLYVADIWPEEDEGAAIFEIFKNLDSYKRYEIFFRLKKSYSAYQILYSIITFCRKCLSEDSRMGVSAGYHRVIMAKRGIVERNFTCAIDAFIRAPGSDVMRSFVFLDKIGQK